MGLRYLLEVYIQLSSKGDYSFFLSFCWLFSLVNIDFVFLFFLYLFGTPHQNIVQVQIFIVNSSRSLID